MMSNEKTPIEEVLGEWLEWGGEGATELRRFRFEAGIPVTERFWKGSWFDRIADYPILTENFAAALIARAREGYVRVEPLEPNWTEYALEENEEVK